MLNHNLDTKIADFGLAIRLESEDERRKTICGTPNYIAPEIIAKGTSGHYFPVDIWSFGVLIYQMLVGHAPFQTESVEKTYKKIQALDYDFPEKI